MVFFLIDNKKIAKKAHQRPLGIDYYSFIGIRYFLFFNKNNIYLQIKFVGKMELMLHKQ